MVQNSNLSFSPLPCSELMFFLSLSSFPLRPQLCITSLSSYSSTLILHYISILIYSVLSITSSLSLFSPSFLGQNSLGPFLHLGRGGVQNLRLPSDPFSRKRKCKIFKLFLGTVLPEMEISSQLWTWLRLLVSSFFLSFFLSLSVN